jgi:hypothetical protein
MYLLSSTSVRSLLNPRPLLPNPHVDNRLGSTLVLDRSSPSDHLWVLLAHAKR